MRVFLISLSLLVGISVPASAQVSCFQFPARAGWTRITLDGFDHGAIVRTITGSWSAHPSLSPVGAEGHDLSALPAPHRVAFEAARERPYWRLGTILVNNNGRLNEEPLRAGDIIPPTSRLDFRFNEQDSRLADNTGQLTICMEPRSAGAGSNPVTSNTASSGTGTARTATPAASAPTERLAGRSEWMACFNDSRQSDSEASRLRRWRADIRTAERALERRADGLRDERNHLSYSYNRDSTGVADRARANQVRMHQQRVDAYNADLDALEDELDDYNRDAADHDARDDVWQARCGGVLFENPRPLVQQYCVGSAASTSFCGAFD
ncbi:hypothetical protein [Maricaulis sp.]|uniref:hypothetical protein n=1 Tax=Maricaulis sp. TaxID=1486257 RepID=UPI0025C1CC87|nr:hypothetical protein [Maricaulis sp.]